MSASFLRFSFIDRFLSRITLVSVTGLIDLVSCVHSFSCRSCRVLSYPILSYPVLSYRILSYPILSYPIISYPILSYPILSYPILSYPTPSYPILSYPILSYPILSYPILSYPVLILSLSYPYSIQSHPILSYPVLILSLFNSIPSYPIRPIPCSGLVVQGNKRQCLCIIYGTRGQRRGRRQGGGSRRSNASDHRAERAIIADHALQRKGFPAGWKVGEKGGGWGVTLCVALCQ